MSSGSIDLGSTLSLGQSLPPFSTVTGDTTVLTTDNGKTFVMNSASSHTFTLPAVTAANLGTTYTFAKINVGNLVIQAATGQKIIDSSATGTLTNASSNEIFATMTLRLMTTTLWTSVGAVGTWVSA